MDKTIDRSNVEDRGAADKLKGHIKQATGTVKEKIGGAVGDEKLRQEGKMQNAEGHADRLKGEVKEDIADMKDKVREGVDKIKAGAEILADKVRGKS